MKVMVRRLRQFGVLVGISVVIGMIAALIAGPTFDGMVLTFGFLAIGTFVAVMLASFLAPWKRTRSAALFLGRAAIVLALTLVTSWGAAHGIVALKIWRGKRYVDSEMRPRLEAIRRSRGAYPLSMNLPPPIQRWSYSSNGRVYWLSVMHPLVCGEVTSYSSETAHWSNAYDPCFY